MSKSTVLALASAASALATAAAAVAEDMGASVTSTDEDTKPAPKKPGRPAKADKVEKEEEKDDETPKGKTREELQDIIAPAVKAGHGEQVRAIIKKHGGGDLAALAEKPEKHEAFEQAIAELMF